MNRPGTTGGQNWKWRLDRPFDERQAERLAELTLAAGRTAAVRSG
jgi:4-alpha-glucanotransferase